MPNVNFSNIKNLEKKTKNFGNKKCQKGHNLCHNTKKEVHFVQISRIVSQDIQQIVFMENANFKSPWKASFFQAELGLENSICLKANIGEKIIGYIIARDFPSELHILNLSVHPEHKRMGVASKLLQYLLALIEGKIVVLEVRASNLAAQNLYKKLAFFELHKRKAYYPDGEDAIVMIKGDLDEIGNT